MNESRGLYFITFSVINSQCNHGQVFTLRGPQFPYHNNPSIYAALTLCRSLGFAYILSFHPCNKPIGFCYFYFHFIDEETEAKRS